MDGLLELKDLFHIFQGKKLFFFLLFIKNYHFLLYNDPKILINYEHDYNLNDLNLINSK